ncbi:alpha/beta-hydrolase [Thozetella sp. PMI_491]|nr:alpha/beta-hydrolase [Thozetella sp. PMI_491]
MKSGVEKPVIVLAHGAWHTPLHYLGLLLSLRGQGYTVVAPPLPTTGFTEGLAKVGLEDGANALRSTMAPFLQDGREIVMVAHSHGGMVATDSVIGETVQERKLRGELGGVKAIVYIAAFAPPQAGLSLIAAIGLEKESDHPDWWYPKDGVVLLGGKALNTLYGDVEDEVARIYYSGVAPQSFASFTEPCKHAASEIQAAKVYVACRADRAIPYEAQVAMAGEAGAETVHFDCGHSPFAKEDELAQLSSVIFRAAES